MTALQELIVKKAKSDIGNKEKKGNSGFFSALKEKAMKAVGWIVFQSWCVYNAEVIWTDSFREIKPAYLKLLSKYFSGSAVKTYLNFKNSPEFHVTSTPGLGFCVAWQDGKSGLGHFGIVTEIDVQKRTFKSVEGNTNEHGAREGTIVGENSHSWDQPFDTKNPNKRWLMGFVNPNPIK